MFAYVYHSYNRTAADLETIGHVCCRSDVLTNQVLSICSILDSYDGICPPYHLRDADLQTIGYVICRSAAVTDLVLLMCSNVDSQAYVRLRISFLIPNSCRSAHYSTCMSTPRLTSTIPTTLQLHVRRLLQMYSADLPHQLPGSVDVKESWLLRLRHSSMLFLRCTSANSTSCILQFCSFNGKYNIHVYIYCP